MFSAWWQQKREYQILRNRQSAATPTYQRFFEAESQTLELDRLRGVAIGDRVRVDINPALALKLAFIAYCVPVILLLAGAAAGRVILQISGVEGATAVLLSPAMGIMGFVGGLFAYRPLVSYLLDDRNSRRDAMGKALLQTSLLIGPG